MTIETKPALTALPTKRTTKEAPMRKTLLAATAILIVSTVPGWTRCQGGGDTSGGCPAPMTNSELEAARRLDRSPTLAITIPKLRPAGQTTLSDQIRAAAISWTIRPAMFNSLRPNQIETVHHGEQRQAGTGTMTGGVSGTGTTGGASGTGNLNGGGSVGSSSSPSVQ